MTRMRRRKQTHPDQFEQHWHCIQKPREVKDSQQSPESGRKTQKRCFLKGLRTNEPCRQFYSCVRLQSVKDQGSVVFMPPVMATCQSSFRVLPTSLFHRPGSYQLPGPSPGDRLLAWHALLGCSVPFLSVPTLNSLWAEDKFNSSPYLQLLENTQHSANLKK